jgi:hypothetical protein
MAKLSQREKYFLIAGYNFSRQNIREVFFAESKINNMANNFKCESCSKEFHISRYSQRSNMKFYDKYGKILNCDCDNKSELIYIENKEFGVPTLGANTKQQHALIKNRSKEHFNKELKEKRDFMNKQRDYHV